MINYDKMGNCELIRTAVALPRMPKNKGLAVIYNTRTKEELTSILSGEKRFKYSEYIKSFYMNHKYKFKLFNKQVNEFMDKEELESVKNTILKGDNYINKSYKLISQYSRNNVYMGMYPYNNYFYERIEKRRGDIVIVEYMKIIDEVCKILSNYDKKIMVIDLLDWGEKIKSAATYNFVNAKTPFPIIFNAMKKFLKNFKQVECEFLFVYGRYKIRVVPSECNENSFTELMTNVRKMSLSTDDSFFREGEPENKLSTEEEIKLALKDRQANVSTRVAYDVIPTQVYESLNVHNFTGTKGSDGIKDLKDVEDFIDKTVKDVVYDDNIDEDKAVKEVKKKINDNKEVLAKIQMLTSNIVTSNYSNADTKRNKMLKEKQALIKINNEGKGLDQILSEAKEKTLVPEEINVRTPNEDMKSMTFHKFADTYDKELYTADTMVIINFFKSRRYPVYILDVKKEDTSDDFNKKYTYTIKMEGADRSRHTLTFDVPRVVDGCKLYLSGNKKIILNQFFLLPISKTGPDVVQLCSNYNKVFMRRVGAKVSPKIERIKKALNIHKGGNKSAKIFLELGDNRLTNTDYMTNIEYDEMAKTYMNIYFNTGNDKYNFYFNQENIRNYISENKLKSKESDNLLPVAIKNNKEVIYLDTNTDMILNTNKSLIDYIGNLGSTNNDLFKKDYETINVGRKYMYTQATIMRRHIPIVLLMSYLEGLTTVLRKANINHYFTDSRERISDSDKNNKEIIQFADGYLVFDRYPMKNSLILNGLMSINTKEYNYDDFDNKETYLEIFENLYQDKKILNAFENFYDLFIDPITYEVCQELNLPTNFVDMIIYGNALLQDNQFITETHMSHYRARNIEVINAILYKQLADAYSVYRTSVGNKNPQKISIPKDGVIKELMTLPIVKEDDQLNPPLEAENLRVATFKGPSGLNVERAYTLEKRAYNKTMRGLIAMSSPPSGSAGVVRQMPMDVNITSPRGYLKIAEEDDLNSANTFCVSELLTTGVAEHDDGSRVFMTTSQTKHTVPCKKYDELLISNGSDKALAQILPNTFIFKAKEDGKVVEVDEKNELIILEYKDGSKDIIDYGTHVAKNGGGGFYINNQQKPVVKEGEKFKKGDILAANDKYFDIDEDRDATYKMGTLAKVAIASGYFTYEDSSMVTEKLSDAMTTNIVMEEDANLGKNSNISFIANIGDRVEVGDPLLIFDESFEDDSINKLLASMSDESKEAFNNISKVPIKAKHAGEIIDIKIYYTLDKSEYSQSAQQIINLVNKRKKSKRKKIESYIDIKESDLIMDPVDKVEAKYGKVAGKDVGDGILIKFYIAYNDKASVGDKIIYHTALKTEICKVLPKGLEPYSEFRPEEEVSAFLSPISTMARITKSIEPQLFGNKVLIELKRKVKEIYER